MLPRQKYSYLVSLGAYDVQSWLFSPLPPTPFHPSVRLRWVSPSSCSAWNQRGSHKHRRSSRAAGMSRSMWPLTYSLLSLTREQDRKESKRRREGRPGRNPFLGRRERTSGLFPGGEDKRLSLNAVNDFSLLESGLITVFPSLPPDRGSALTAGWGSFFSFFSEKHLCFFLLFFCFLFLSFFFFFYNNHNSK